MDFRNFSYMIFDIEKWIYIKIILNANVISINFKLFSRCSNVDFYSIEIEQTTLVRNNNFDIEAIVS